jgi:hypothetical protein
MDEGDTGSKLFVPAILKVLSTASPVASYGTNFQQE